MAAERHQGDARAHARCSAEVQRVIVEGEQQQQQQTCQQAAEAEAAP
jgi:hypothetical protein